MHAICAIDSFKGSLSSFQANAAAVQAVGGIGFPVSDGGEGFQDVISGYHGVSDGVVYIESARHIGYDMIPESLRHPTLTTSYSLGQAIATAAKGGPSKVVVGLGGTATCDAGVGVLQALGCRFYLEDGSLLADGKSAMFQPISRIEVKVPEIPIELWCDTRSGMSGPQGAVRMYGAQKGLRPEEMDGAERWMERMESLYAAVGKECCGAAGGIAGALAYLCGTDPLLGAPRIVEVSGMVEAMCDADLIITGEGCFDEQSLTGKIPVTIAETARRVNPGAKVICLCGKKGTGQLGPFDEVIQITPEGQSLEEALLPEVAAENLKNALIRWSASR